MAGRDGSRNAQEREYGLTPQRGADYHPRWRTYELRQRQKQLR